MAGNNREDDLAKLRELVKDVEVAMLVTSANDGALRARPMVTREVEPDGTLWFFTGSSSGKALEIRADQHVCVAYSSPNDQRYVSVSGRAQVVRDQAKAKELWNPAYKAWFPKGLDDPELALLKVEIEAGEYWDPPTSTIVHLIGLAKTLVTGKQYEPGPDEHGKVMRAG